MTTDKDIEDEEELLAKFDKILKKHFESDGIDDRKLNYISFEALFRSFDI